MFDIGFFELIIIMVIAVVVIGPENLPRLAKAVGKGWGEFQAVFEGLKKDVMDETDDLRSSIKMDQLKQDVSAATQVDVDLDLDDKPNQT